EHGRDPTATDPRGARTTHLAVEVDPGVLGGRLARPVGDQPAAFGGDVDLGRGVLGGGPALDQPGTVRDHGQAPTDTPVGDDGDVSLADLPGGQRDQGARVPSGGAATPGRPAHAAVTDRLHRRPAHGDLDRGVVVAGDGQEEQVADLHLG